MVHQSLVTRPAVPSHKVPSQKLPKALAQDELEALKSVRMNPRDRALIAVLSMCGLCVSEACSLTIDNIHWSTDTPSFRFTCKRGKERVVPMNPEVQDVLREWLESRQFSDSKYVFCNLRNGQRLSRKTVVRDVSHTGARDQIDLTFAVVLLLSSAVSFTTREIEFKFAQKKEILWFQPVLRGLSQRIKDLLRQEARGF